MTKVHITNLYGMAGDSTVILAQNAVTDIARALGYREIGIYFYNISTDSPSERSKRLDGIMASISFGDIVIFQSPTWNGWEFDAEFVAKLKDLRVKLVIFIHDVIPLMFRDNAYLMPTYMEMFNQADVIIAPSQQMVNRLCEAGLTVEKILIQEFWDHPHNLSLNQPVFKKEIFFAGSLTRFPELQNWVYETPLRVFANEPKSNPEANLVIEGWKRNEELLMELSKGGFGLVWNTQYNDGENVDYYEMNISHKLSTYLAAGIPVIVPNTLSNSHLIEERGLGFAVNSLEEANQLVQNMAPESYQEISSRAQGFAFLLKEGYITKKLLIDAINFSAQIREGAVVEDSVIMSGAVIGKGAKIKRAIIGEGAHISEGVEIDGTEEVQVVGYNEVVGVPKDED